METLYKIFPNNFVRNVLVFQSLFLTLHPLTERGLL
jgi:hypothetical protein